MSSFLGASAPQFKETLSPRAQRFLSLARWYWKRGLEFKACREWISSKLRVCVRYVSEAVAELLEKGIIQVERRYRRTNIYRPVEQAQMALDFGPPVAEMESTQVVKPKAVCTTVCTTVIKPYSVRLWRRVVSVPLVLFRVPENWRKRRDSKKPPKRPSEAELNGDPGLLAFYGYSGGPR